MTSGTQAAFEVLFWGSAGVLLYIYAGYPLLLALLAHLAPRRLKPSESFYPSVTLVISAYNESQIIRAKLENSLALDYPKNLLEIMVISDCSNDGTDEIVSEYTASGVRLVRQQQRLGKSAGLNLGVSQAKGGILVFSDANALYLPDAIRHLVRHFADPRVGYVVGNSRYVEKGAESPSAESEGLYWRLETWVKAKESRFASVVGGDGAIYAIRRELYTPLRETDISDFLNPLQITDRGYRGVFEPAAVSYEETAESFPKEFRRKVRIISRSLNALMQAPGVLNPLKNPRHWFLLVSHKLLRWFSPLFVIVFCTTAFALWESPFYRLVAWFEIAFFALAGTGGALQRRENTWKIFSLPYYFCLMNAASLIGCFKCFRGDLSATWMSPRAEA